MIEWEKISDIDVDTPEGKALLSAIAILTSIEINDIKASKWGGMVHPDDALKQVVDLTNKGFYKEEWEKEQERIKRDSVIDEVLNNDKQ